MVTETFRNNVPFLLMEGGPLFHIEQRIGSIWKHVPLTKRRALLSIVLSWISLLVLSLLQGTAFGQTVPVPFLRDFSAYTPFLLAVPFFLLAENILGPRIADTAEHFINANVVLPADYGSFDKAVLRGLRFRDAVFAEILIAILALVLSVSGFMATAVHASTWYAIRSNTGPSFTWAGWWYVAMALPLYHFLSIRWFWRVVPVVPVPRRYKQIQPPVIPHASRSGRRHRLHRGSAEILRNSPFCLFLLGVKYHCKWSHL